MALGDLYKFFNPTLVTIPNDHPIKTVLSYTFPAERIDVRASIVLTPPIPPVVPSVPQIVVMERHISLELAADVMVFTTPNENGSWGDHKPSLPGQGEVITVGDREFDFRGVEDPALRTVFVNLISKYTDGFGPLYAYGFIRGRSWGCAEDCENKK
jgi:hypothetical protein